MRHAVPEDREALAALQAEVHAGPGGTPNTALGTWMADLLAGTHPTVEVSDISVVVDQRSGALVSSASLIRQVWMYSVVPFGVGRVELTATHPDYRGQGLITRQLRALHEWSSARGDLVQATSDLMFFHGEFGYHMALVQRAGRGGSTHQLPAVDPTRSSITVRPATPDDVSTLVAADRVVQDRALISCPRDKALWQYELTGRSEQNLLNDRIMIIESGSEPVGYLVLGYAGIPTFPIPEWLPGFPCPEPVISVSGFEILPDSSWFTIVPAVLRQLAVHSGNRDYVLWLGEDHPAYAAVSDSSPRRPPQLGWFLRAPDAVRLLRLFSPVLEERLFHSSARGFTGSLRLHFYTHGIIITFAQGRVTQVKYWHEHSRRGSDASMPKQMFLQLLMGHASITEITPAFPDCRLQTRFAKIIIPIIFPKGTSQIWPIA